jgi:hypothetical protein
MSDARCRYDIKDTFYGGKEAEIKGISSMRIELPARTGSKQFRRQFRNSL